MKHAIKIGRQRKRRAFHVRNRIRRDAARPRLSVFRSHRHMYAQIVDDRAGRTLVAASTLEAALRAQLPCGGNKAAAAAMGKALAEKALAAGIREVVFDRREYKYHGRVAALADGAREGGLVF